MRLDIALVTGEACAVDLPDAGDPAAAINEAADAISAEYEVRRGRGGRSNQERTGAWLLPICVDLIDYCDEKMAVGVLLSRLAPNKSYSDQYSWVQPAMAAIFFDRKIFTPQDLSYYSPRVYYALRHYVPGIFVNGFLSQVKGLATRLNLETIEPGFEDWIVMRRGTRLPLSNSRGEYPSLIDERASRQLGRFVETMLQIKYPDLETEHASGLRKALQQYSSR